MYLSRLQLNAGNRQVWRNVIANPYKVHQLVMRGFPDDVNREQAEVLHRLDTRDWGATLLVQSALAPDWSMVNPDYLLPADPFDPLPNPAVKPLQLPLQTGQLLSFRLVANPTVKKKREDKKHSNRVPLVHEDKQIEWLRKRAGAGGFKLLQTMVSQMQNQKIWKQKGAKPITLYTVQFDGYLQITNPNLFLQTLQKGIGPAKAFGCGLLSLAPA